MTSYINIQKQDNRRGDRLTSKMPWEIEFFLDAISEVRDLQFQKNLKVMGRASQHEPTSQVPWKLQNLLEVRISNFKNSKADVYSMLKCTFKPNFDFPVALGTAEPLGGHVGGK